MHNRRIIFSKIWYWSTLSVIFFIACAIIQEIARINFQLGIEGNVTFHEVIEHIFTTAFNLVNSMVVSQYGTYAVIVCSRYKCLNQYLKSAFFCGRYQNSGKLFVYYFIYYLYYYYLYLLFFQLSKNEIKIFTNVLNAK